MLCVLWIALLPGVIAQQPDTVPPSRVDTSIATIDTSRVAADTVQPRIAGDSVVKKPWDFAYWQPVDSLPLSVQVMRRIPYFGFRGVPVVVHSGLRSFEGKELLFYALIVLLLAFALLRQAFPKYFVDLTRLLFRNTLKQKQLREQLMQTPLPSLLLNIFFVVTGAFYIDLLLNHYQAAPVENFWLLLMYCAAGLAAVYTVKFLGLKITGWIFNVQDAADTYIFIVFVINKVLGIFLLPFLVMLSFMKGTQHEVVMVISWCGIGLLYLYRFLLGYSSVRNQVRFNPFHFFLYLVAVEVAPLLLIYKALLFIFR